MFPEPNYVVDLELAVLLAPTFQWYRPWARIRRLTRASRTTSPSATTCRGRASLVSLATLIVYGNWLFKINFMIEAGSASKGICVCNNFDGTEQCNLWLGMGKSLRPKSKSKSNFVVINTGCDKNKVLSSFKLCWMSQKKEIYEFNPKLWYERFRDYWR